MTIVWSFAGVFQSTLSVRRATGNIGYNRQNVLISIHALRKESDRCHSQPPCNRGISIHALRKESDRIHEPNLGVLGISIHALRKESDEPI